MLVIGDGSRNALRPAMIALTRAILVQGTTAEGLPIPGVSAVQSNAYIGRVVMKSLLVTLVAVGVLAICSNSAQAQYFGSYGYSGSRTTIAIGFGNVGGFYGHPTIGYHYSVGRPIYGYYDPYFYRPVYPVVPLYGGPSCYRGSGYYRW